MPIFIKNVEWTQDSANVVIKIPLKGQKTQDDVILWRKFLKINVQPYFYEVFFESPIDIEQSSFKILDTGIVCTLRKLNDDWWPRLGRFSKADNSDDAIPTDEKAEIWREYEQDVARLYKDRCAARDTRRRAEIDKEMERQYETRRKIEEIQQNLKDQLIGKQSFSDPRLNTCDVSCEGTNIKTPSNSIKPKNADSKSTKKPMKSLPPIRSFAEIDVTFSERRFVTPSRESQDHAEQEWCTKQHEYMKNSIGFCDADLNDDERDPTWLLNKGNDFYGKGNYLAAISAYSSGLCIAKESPSLYLARAEAHFQLGNYKRCVDDCSEAYERFKPAVQSNLKDRIQCLELRGRSLMELGYKQHGQAELNVAAGLV